MTDIFMSVCNVLICLLFYCLFPGEGHDGREDEPPEEVHRGEVEAELYGCELAHETNLSFERADIDTGLLVDGRGLNDVAVKHLEEVAVVEPVEIDELHGCEEYRGADVGVQGVVQCAQKRDVVGEGILPESAQAPEHHQRRAQQQERGEHWAEFGHGGGKTQGPYKRQNGTVLIAIGAELFQFNGCNQGLRSFIQSAKVRRKFRLTKK